MPFEAIAGGRIEYQRIDAARGGLPTIVMLHEGLGSLSMWKSFPAAVAQRTQAEVIVYSRHCYGRSASRQEPPNVRYMHDEASIVLPALLDRWGIEEPLLFGHSDGASIALIHAGGSERRVAGVIAMAPHVLVEDISIRSIDEAKRAYATTDLRERLSRYHEDADSAFHRWNDNWLNPDFRAWNIEDSLPRIECPILAIQGEDDVYGTMTQIDRIAAGARDVELLKLTGCGHSPQRDQPEAVLQAVAELMARVSGA